MITPHQILVDLLAGQSTSDSIAGRLHLPTLVIEAMLKRHAIEGLVTAGTINDTLTVWLLTSQGTEAALALRVTKKRSASPLPQIPQPLPA